MPRAPQILAVVSMPWLLAACGGMPAQPRGPNPDVVIPRLFDPTSLYRTMGLIAHGAPLPFVASVRFLTGDPDSTTVVVGLSLNNSALSFRRASDGFEAAYRVEVLFQQDRRVVQRFTAEEQVRVATYRETQRADESVVFQQQLHLAPGAYDVEITVWDEHGQASARDQRALVVPLLTAGRVGMLPVYTTDLEAWVVNPRATIPYGTDSLHLLLAPSAGTTGAARLLVRTPDARVLHDTVVPFDTGGWSRTVVSVAPDHLSVGELDVLLVAAADTTRLAVLVSFSDQWAITNFDEVLSLLRYFGADSALTALRDAAPEERPAAWRAFWQATDPNPRTPEHEGLERYFQRVQEANARFVEGGDPGWLTDRGEVYIVLGPPDEVFDQSGDFQGGRRIIRWTYVTNRVVLDFMDDTGFGRFRLTNTSRLEFQRASLRARQEL
ncbi:MAG: GWxTD domain-containing protein [Gemmatimonadales bacterium]